MLDRRGCDAQGWTSSFFFFLLCPACAQTSYGNEEMKEWDWKMDFNKITLIANGKMMVTVTMVKVSTPKLVIMFASSQLNSKSWIVILHGVAWLQIKHPAIRNILVAKHGPTTLTTVCLQFPHFAWLHEHLNPMIDINSNNIKITVLLPTVFFFLQLQEMYIYQRNKWDVS